LGRSTTEKKGTNCFRSKIIFATPHRTSGKYLARGVEFGYEDSILVHRNLLQVCGEEKLTKSKTRTAEI